MKFKHLLPLLLSAVLSAQAYALTEGEDYLVLDKPIPQEQPGKIEVLEFSAILRTLPSFRSFVIETGQGIAV